jgi:hypothetical protein
MFWMETNVQHEAMTVPSLSDLTGGLIAPEYCPHCLKHGQYREAILKGMCRLHYQRERRGSLDLDRPPRAWTRREITDDNPERRRRRKRNAPVVAPEPIEKLVPWIKTPKTMITHDPVIGVVCHAKRYWNAAAIADKTAAEVISVDDGSLGCEANHRRTWSWLQSSPARWSLILEDDVVVASAFRFQLNQIVARAGASIISLYLGRGRPTHQQPAIGQAIISLPSEDVCFLSAKDLFSAQAYLVPTVFLPTLLAKTNDGPVPIDEQISAVVREHKMPVHYTWPSLVDHRSDMEPMITERHDGQPRIEQRVAWKFGGRPTWRPTYAPLRTPEELGITVIRS